MPNRDYAALNERIWPLERGAAMRAIVDAVWELHAATGVSWVGFYVHRGGDQLHLEARRDKPACSPIGLHGACGRSFLSRRALIVTDVRRLGGGYIACDPRDQSELVIPLVDVNDICWGVLDVDSYDVNAFSPEDVVRLNAVLIAAKLQTIRISIGEIDVI
ncbi:MAG: GAF domain-containing protein [Planctomycetes bacterium]|nr:GAF domain-containing protein [Planctomycetota bacterium]